MTTDSEINWPRQAAIDLIALPSRDVSSKRPPITYGAWEFSAPRMLFKAPVPAKPGLFAIHVRTRHWMKWQFEPIHFGESSNLYRKLTIDGGGEFVRWLMHPEALNGLFVSICLSNGMNKPAREFAVGRLLARYRPELIRSADDLMAELNDPLAGNWQEDMSAVAAQGASDKIR